MRNSVFAAAVLGYRGEVELFKVLSPNLHMVVQAYVSPYK
jgi:hypothetical protein